MFDIDEYLSSEIRECRNAFGERLLYIGLQGSYMRGEATDRSDIDVMIILDDFSVADMDAYREILVRIGNYERSCGFICGRDEILRWSPLEACQLRYTTKDLFGRLKDYLPSATREDGINYVKMSLGDVYHILCHRYIHGDRTNSAAVLRGTGKKLFFLIQNLHFLESGSFAVTKRALREQVSEADRAVLDMALLPDYADPDAAFRTVFDWCQKAFIRVGLLQ